MFWKLPSRGIEVYVNLEEIEFFQKNDTDGTETLLTFRGKNVSVDTSLVIDVPIKEFESELKKLGMLKEFEFKKETKDWNVV